jgi:hypothetical protein
VELEMFKISEKRIKEIMFDTNIILLYVDRLLKDNPLKDLISKEIKEKGLKDSIKFLIDGKKPKIIKPDSLSNKVEIIIRLLILKKNDDSINITIDKNIKNKKLAFELKRLVEDLNITDYKITKEDLDFIMGSLNEDNIKKELFSFIENR